MCSHNHRFIYMGSKCQNLRKSLQTSKAFVWRKDLLNDFGLRNLF